jgi:hypothetical protein
MNCATGHYPSSAKGSSGGILGAAQGEAPVPHVRRLCSSVIYHTNVDLYHRESRAKNVRFMGELIKFGVAPPIIAFRCFQVRTCVTHQCG